jgi:hypothetical protein
MQKINCGGHENSHGSYENALWQFRGILYKFRPLNLPESRKCKKSSTENAQRSRVLHDAQ